MSKHQITAVITGRDFADSHLIVVEADIFDDGELIGRVALVENEFGIPCRQGYPGEYGDSAIEKWVDHMDRSDVNYPGAFLDALLIGPPEWTFDSNHGECPEDAIQEAVRVAAAAAALSWETTDRRHWRLKLGTVTVFTIEPDGDQWRAKGCNDWQGPESRGINAGEAWSMVWDLGVEHGVEVPPLTAPEDIQQEATDSPRWKLDAPGGNLMIGDSIVAAIDPEEGRVRVTGHNAWKRCGSSLVANEAAALKLIASWCEMHGVEAPSRPVAVLS